MTHQGEGHIKVKVKYLHPFKFYVAHTLCKRVVCIQLKCYLLGTVFMLLLVSGLNGDNTGRKDAPIQEGNVFSRVCPSVCSSGGGVPPYMALAQGLLFTIKTGHSHRAPLMPEILQCPWWQEDSIIDLTCAMCIY